MIVCFFWQTEAQESVLLCCSPAVLSGRTFEGKFSSKWELVLTCTYGQIKISTCRPNQCHVIQGVRKPLSCRHNLNKDVALLRKSCKFTTNSASMSFLPWWYMFHFDPCTFVAFDRGTCGDCGLVSWIRGNVVRGDACLFWLL